MPRILVIEDEPGLQQVLDYNLRREGHEVFLASSRAEGLRLAREQRPDLVLLDWMLPDRSGTEVCRQLKGAPATSRIPVVFVTARGDRSIASWASRWAPRTTSSSPSAFESSCCACKRCCAAPTA